MPISVLVALLLGCAKVGPPTGGPVDKEPPRILSHYPESDALEVARDTAVEIAFSEPMNREQTEAAIFTSPAGPLQLSWRGPRLRIAMPLAEERTYVLTVGTGARDLRGNALTKSFTLAFATGSQLDQGLVRGWVYQDHQPVAGAHVWAYDLGTFSGRVGLDEPSYQTQSGADGGYEFARLAPGHYRVLAFRDKNRNALPDADEWLALPASPVEVGEEEVQAGDLALVRRQMPTPVLKRVQAIHAERLMLLFAEAVDPQDCSAGSRRAGGGVAVRGPGCRGENLRRDGSARAGSALCRTACARWCARAVGRARARQWAARPQAAHFRRAGAGSTGLKRCFGLAFFRGHAAGRVGRVLDGERLDASISRGLAVASAQQRPLCARRTASTGCVSARGAGRSARGPGRQWPRRQPARARVYRRRGDRGNSGAGAGRGKGSRPGRGHQRGRADVRRVGR